MVCCFSFQLLAAQVPTSPSTSLLESNNYVIVPNESVLNGKNGYEWKTRSPSTGKTPSRNVVHIRPGVIAPLRNIIDPLHAFQTFFTDSILNKVLVHTNEQIEIAQQPYKIQSETVSKTDLDELKALLGLYILAAALKDNHLSSEVMFDSTFCGTRYRATMSQKRFDFLSSCLRFDDKQSRIERREISRFAPISEIWEEFIDVCRQSYKPSSYVTIDEQLVGFRGRCPFRMYLPSKPAKYGIKFILLCDASTKYLIDAIPYVGKTTNTFGSPLAEYCVVALTKSIHGSNRNITMDNWFTSIPLAEKLLQNPYKLTVIGTLKKNKTEIPSQFIENSKNRQVNTSLFGFSKDNNMCLVSYKPKPNKLVVLLSSMHTTSSVNESTYKPEIIHCYNSTKGAVDTFDQMCANMSCNRKTKRWPMCVFYNLINMACINSYILYSHNVISYGGKSLSRKMFMFELHKSLTNSWQRQRLNRGSNMSRELRTIISEVLNEQQIDQEANQQDRRPEGQDQKGRRTYCHICSTSKRRMTTTYCIKCKKPICGEHQNKLCLPCCN